MNHLYRELAPVSDDAWEQIEDEAKSRLVTYLAARKLVDLSRVRTGGTTRPPTWAGSTRWPARPKASAAAQRRVLPAGRTAGGVQRVARGARRRRPRRRTTSSCPNSTRPCARSRWPRTSASSTGTPRRGSSGITERSSHPPLTIEEDMEHYPTVVAQAADVLRQAGIGGPYGLAIGPEIYTGIVETHRARGPLAARPPPPDSRRAAGVGARRRGRHRAQPARWRLRPRLRAGPLHRLPATTTPRRCVSTSRRASASGCIEPDAAVTLQRKS